MVISSGLHTSCIEVHNPQTYLMLTLPMKSWGMFRRPVGQSLRGLKTAWAMRLREEHGHGEIVTQMQEIILVWTFLESCKISGKMLGFHPNYPFTIYYCNWLKRRSKCSQINTLQQVLAFCGHVLLMCVCFLQVSSVGLATCWGYSMFLALTQWLLGEAPWTLDYE